MGQRTLLVGQREDDARLVGLGQRAQQVGLVGMRQHQEAREVVLVVLDVVFQHLQPVEPRSLGMADGGPPAPAALGNHLRRTGRVLGLHVLHARMLRQEPAALHQRHGVRVDFLDALPVVIGQAADAVRDVELVLTDNGRARVAQQLVVVQQRAGNGVLDGHQAHHRGVLAHALEHLLERRAADELYLLTLEIEVGGYVVERAHKALYRYSLHTSVLKKEAPLSPCL